MWYHLKCIPTLLLDGAKRYSEAAISCAKRGYAAISDDPVQSLLALMGSLVILCWVTIAVVWR